MGTNEEQARYAAEHGLPWCEGAWCAEERRHSNTLARIIERLVKVSPSRDNPNVPMIVTSDDLQIGHTPDASDQSSIMMTDVGANVYG